MKNFWLLAVGLFLIDFKSTLAQTCPLTSQISPKSFSAAGFPQKSLSYFWAQERVGADLARDFMAKQKNLYRPQIAIFDDEGSFQISNTNTTPGHTQTQMVWGRPSSEPHGTKVANLINGLGLESTSPWSELIWLQSITPRFPYEKGIQEILNQNLKIDFINQSMSWGHSQEGSKQIKTHMKRLVDRGAILFVTAGNLYPLKVNAEKVHYKNRILSGSSSPLGLKSSFSQEDTQVELYAPSDRYLLSSGARREDYSLFGGTSGANPILLGAAANIKAFFPKATRPFLLKFLKETAFYSVAQQKVVNIYKSSLAAKKLKQICGSNLTCASEKLSSVLNVNFDPLSLQRLKAFFPKCISPKLKKKSFTCTEKKEAFRQLRRLHLLHHTNAEINRLLSCVYKKEELLWNSTYHHLLATRGLERKELLEKLYQNKFFSAFEALRNISVFTPNFQKRLIEDSLNSSNSSLKDYAREAQKRLQQM